MIIAVNQNHITQCKRIVHVHATLLLSSALRHTPSTRSGARRRAAKWPTASRLRTELPDYWPPSLRYLATIAVDHWRADAAARLVASAVENDHV